MQTAAKPIVFYDGTCVLCHGFVRWVLANDQAAVFQFAPLQGETFTRTFATDQRQDLPDSVVVRNEAGGLYLRSDAVIYVLRTLGRAKLARALQMVPR
ncbi:MAG TPA: DCC1-like thiol-disulfide oxidoreductase family protein, partial [Terriglobales bacterium]|nr:DCC1-like thiol-disulfide oxidoreductase family protein [Terriglobales bacterium]